jgi:2-phospho-L-lactate guanylyltransferase
VTGRDDEAILIPVKGLDRAKLRLSDHLPSSARRTLGLAMLTDILEATGAWTRRFLVTDDPDARTVGMTFGCSLVHDPAAGLNAALEAGTEVAAAAGATALLVLPCDVPLVTAADVAAVFACPENVVVAQSPDGGTNALLRRPPDAMPTRFGPASADAHRRAAEKARVDCRVGIFESLSLDVDTYSDLVRLARLTSDRASVRLAREIVPFAPAHPS